MSSFKKEKKIKGIWIVFLKEKLRILSMRKKKRNKSFSNSIQRMDGGYVMFKN